MLRLRQILSQMNSRFLRTHCVSDGKGAAAGRSAEPRSGGAPERSEALDSATRAAGEDAARGTPKKSPGQAG